ncbi:hypothetical protein [Amycolatopsis australiensis]|uniref:Uncharacterized protein n=1 Tax=Amycolatopsis australiensis TaxID=546364 RepID=A0A1K1LKQ1_9PSEU|nr:hypothetical protein [Amycolatopsis australiensis]SFW11415.1 hypothetical protein SAMN04489730_0012 [Amycolatopsis australiensis]SFW12089.1 hypothetical protein SAMN04489730_0087 [Amycolatopsis australiensis]
MTAAMTAPAPASTSPSEASLQVVPIDPARWPANPGQFVAAHYRWVTLDLDTGELALSADPAYCGPDDEQLRKGELPRELRGHWYTRGHGFPTPMPRRMVWFLCRYDDLDADQATRVLELIAVHARTVLAGQVEVPERSAPGCDWSLEAAIAVRTIAAITESPQRALREPSQVGSYAAVGVLALEDAFALAPALADPQHAAATDAELDAAAAKLAEHLPYQWAEQPELQCAAGHADRSFGYRTIHAVGVLAALYRYRRIQAGTLSVCQAPVWFAGRPARLAVVHDDTTDAELARLAHAEDQAAAAAGQRLVGALAYLQASRAAQRDHIRHRLRTARGDRAALLLRVDAWGDPADGGDTTRTTTLAQLAGLPASVVAALRERAHLTNLAAAADNARAIVGPTGGAR